MRVSSILCWTLITLVCLGLVGSSVRNGLASGRAAPVSPRQRVPGTVDAQARMVGQSLVALHHGSPAQARESYAMVTGLLAKTTESRVAMAVVAGEVIGRTAAVDRLAGVDDPDARAFEAVYAARPATRPSTSPAAPGDARVAAVPVTTAPEATDPADLRQRYGWFVDLAESSGESDTEPRRADVLRRADRTASVLAGATVVLTVGFFVGLATSVTAVVLLATGRLRDRVGRPAGSTGVYVEAFTVYLALLLGASLVVPSLPWLPLWARLALQTVSVAAGLAWPFVRGVGWPALRRDWGLHRGRGVVVEAACGIGGYIAGLPLVIGLALLGSLALKLAGETASHPATALAETHPWLILLLASVYAPLTEELMFRGALLGHLRGTWGVFMAALVNGVVFASVHPQGWALVPALAAIGAVLGLVRQWRGTLIASTAAHCLNNTFVLMLVLLTQ